MTRFLSPWLLLITCAIGAEDPAAKATKELSTAYTKLGGYIAHYHSERQGKALDSDLALDRASGRVISETKLTSDGATSVTRMWTDGDDEIFVSEGDQTAKMTGILAEMKFFGALQDRIGLGHVVERTPDEEKARFGLTPQILLAESTISQGVFTSTTPQPGWADAVRGATVKTTDDKTVTFATKTSGELTISRETGLLVRQSFPDGSAEPRVLEIKSVRVNPGTDAVKELSAKWDTSHATLRSSIALNGKCRAAIFQMTIQAVESGRDSGAKLDGELTRRGDELRTIALGWIAQSKVVDDATWKKMFDVLKKEQRARWLGESGVGKKPNEAAFETYLGRADVRERARDFLADAVKEMPACRTKILDELFPVRLKTTDISGESARTSIEDACVKAYTEALAEKKIQEFWGERHGQE